MKTLVNILGRHYTKVENRCLDINILNNIVSNEQLPHHPFEQKINSANKSLICDVAISKRKNCSVTNSIPAKTITNNLSLENDSKTINSEGNIKKYLVLYLPIYITK